MNFLDEIKKAILTSKQLELKAENFSKLHKFFDKEYDDFSFKVEDTFELILDFGEKDYSMNCLPSEKNLENDFYYFIVNEALKEVDFPTNQKNYIFQLGLRNTYELRFEFLIELKHSYGNEGFEVKKLHKSKVFSICKFQKELIQIKYKIKQDDTSHKVIKSLLNNNESLIKWLDDYDQKSYEILGYLLEQDESVFLKLKNDQKYLFELENKIKTLKHELFGSPEQIVEEKSQLGKDLIDKWREIANNWLNENCKPELRNLVQVNLNCYYFSLSEEWLTVVDFLNSKCEYWFEKSGAEND